MYIYYFGGEQNDEFLIKAANYLKTFLATGVTAEELKKSIYMAWMNNTNQIKILNPKNTGNILEQDRIYFHNALRKPLPNLVVDVNYETGEMTRVGESEFYNEMKACYTLKDLDKRITSNNLVDETMYTESRRIGLLGYFVKKYGIEITLFMIDVALDYREDNAIIDLKCLDNYYQTAKEYLDNNIASNKSVEGDKLWLKKRFKN